jgi:hypothetical protein
MKATKQTEHLVAAFCAANKSSMRTSPEMDERVLADVLSAYKKPTTSKPAPAGTNIGRIFMKSPLTKLAFAAAVIIACAVALSLWRTTGSGVALADVLARVEQVKAFRSKSSVMINPGKPGGVEFRVSSVFSKEYGSKGTLQVREDPNGGWEPLGERYYYPQKKTFVQIGHPIKTYFRWEVDDVEAQQQQESLSLYIDPGKILEDIMACKYETLGRSTIDRVEVEGFRTTDPNCRCSFGRSLSKDPHMEVDIKVWVDVKTRLPVRYDDHSSGHDEMENPWVVQCIATDFEWDVPVAPAEFDPPPVPDGYTVVNKRPEESDEEAAIHGLRECAALFGNYIETISDDTELTEMIFSAIEESVTPAAMQLKKKMEELTENERLEGVRRAVLPVRRLIWFYVRLIQDKKDPAYYGKTVTPKDADKVLLRWKLSDSDYRVIFGDLRAETVSPERLAELEKGLSK